MSLFPCEFRLVGGTNTWVDPQQLKRVDRGGYQKFIRQSHTECKELK